MPDAMTKTDKMSIRKTAGKRAPSAERVAAFQTGISAESRACVYLIAKGYRILARRFKTPYGEIDIVARKRGLLAFVEVKARASLDDAAYSVTPQQRARIVKAAQMWLAAHDDHANLDMRFDVVLIAPKNLPRHLMSAFDASH
jgi:putative endonuclease